MDIVCYSCQGTIEVRFKDIYKVDDEYFFVYCPACDAENQVWDVYDWFSNEEISYIEEHNNIDTAYKEESDEDLLDMLDGGCEDD